MHEMERVVDTSAPMGWLKGSPIDEGLTGFDATGWPASTWVLHAMYENPALTGLGTHDEVHRRRLTSGNVTPLIIGEVNLDGITTVTGTPLGFMINPGWDWCRVSWEEYLRRFPNFSPHRDVPPCHRWFPPGSWPMAVSPPPEGSLDEESLDGLIQVLVPHSPEGVDTLCFAFYCPLAARDFDAVHLWQGPLGGIPSLLTAQGGPYDFSPSNVWPVGREWFVWTDYDLEATKISGDQLLMTALHAEPRLECLAWSPPTRP